MTFLDAVPWMITIALAGVMVRWFGVSALNQVTLAQFERQVKAIQWANRSQCFAVPSFEAGAVRWFPRLPNGDDIDPLSGNPELFTTWEDAILATYDYHQVITPYWRAKRGLPE